MTREEAMETVRRCCPRISDSECDFETAMRVLIPELAESEDERIRKEIIDYLHLVGKGDGDYAQPMIDRWIAWLEKQKELWTPSKEVMDVLYALAYITNEVDDHKDDVIIRLYQDLKREFFNGASYENMFPKEAKQKEQKPRLIGEDSVEKKARQMYETGQTIEEQKPVEWSDNFEENIGRLLGDKLTWHSEDGSISSAVFIDDRTLKDICAGIWFYVGKEVLKYPNKELNVSEWSEEDENMLKNVLFVLESYVSQSESASSPSLITTYPTYFKEIDWLKSLRPQSQHRDTYYDIIHNILDMLKGMDFMKITPEHRVSLLNDIRVKCKNADECAAILDEPQWKPSEEQMEALEIILRYGDKESTHIKNLTSLYNQLKKL